MENVWYAGKGEGAGVLDR